MRSIVVSASVFCGLFCSCLVSPAFGSIPDPFYCSVTGSVSATGVLIAPGPMTGTSLTISVRNSSNMPIPSASVIVLFDPAIRVCADAQHTGLTDYSGRCVIQVRGGGCARNTVDACVVTANGMLIKSFSNVKSPDNAAHTQSLADGVVSVGDLTYFADQFLGVAAAACHDYDNDDDCDIVDLTYFGGPFRAGLRCPLR
jgi:hypothetical protein